MPVVVGNAVVTAVHGGRGESLRTSQSLREDHAGLFAIAFLQWPLALIHVSGFLEVIGRTRVGVLRICSIAGWGLIALLVAVFPANVQMLLNSGQFPLIPFWALVAELPLPGVPIAWVRWTAIKQQNKPIDSSRGI